MTYSVDTAAGNQPQSKLGPELGALTSRLEGDVGRVGSWGPSQLDRASRGALPRYRYLFCSAAPEKLHIVRRLGCF